MIAYNENNNLPLIVKFLPKIFFTIIINIIIQVLNSDGISLE